MRHFPNSNILQLIGLNDHSPHTFVEQLKAKGFKNLGYRNGIKADSDEDLIIRGNNFQEIYSTTEGYHVHVCIDDACFYESDSSD